MHGPTAVEAASPTRLAAFADTAAFGIVVATAFAVPLTFSIADADVFAQPKTVLVVGLAGALCILLVAWWMATAHPGIAVHRQPLAAALLIFVGWNVAAAIFGRDPGHALTGERLQHQGLAAFLAYAVFMVASWATVRTPGRRRAFLVALSASALLVTAYAVVQRTGLDPIWDGLPEDRVFSTIGQPNALGAFLVLVLPFVLALAYVTTHAVRRVALIGLGLAMAFAVLLTLSRGAFLAFGVLVAIVAATVWTRRSSLVTRRGITIGLLMTLVVIAAAVAVPDLRIRAMSAIDRFTHPGRVEQASSSAHLDQWAVGMAIALDHPLMGSGQDSYVLLFPEYRDDVLPPDRADIWSRYRPESPHNVYLAVTGGAGLVALAAYLAIIAIVARRAIRAVRCGSPTIAVFAGAVLAGIGANMVTDSFMTAETTESVLTWMILGVGAALAPSEAHLPRNRAISIGVCRA